MSLPPEIESLRDRLDTVDQALLDALTERTRIVREVGRFKAESGANLRDLPREEDILTRLVARAENAGLDRFFVARVYKEILGHSMRLQEAALGTAAVHEGPALRIGYQGSEGAWSHLAAQRHFGAHDGDVSHVGFDSFEEMLQAVRDGEVERALLPVENTISGSIPASFDLLAALELSIVGEEVQEVQHCLLALEDVPLSKLRRISSHPVALAQCGKFLATLGNCHVEAFTDTAMAARRVRDAGDPTQAAIASEEAGRIHGLTVIRRGIADQRENFTRMLVVAVRPQPVDLRVPCKTTLLFTTRHEEGALVTCLNILAAHHLSMTRLESRPRPHNPWEYQFHLDFEGNLADPEVAEALREMATQSGYVRVLGCYPARTTASVRAAEPRPAVSPARPSAHKPVIEVGEPAVAAASGGSAPPMASRTYRREDTVIPVGTTLIGGPVPVVIAGPCAVESEEQIQACARVVKAMGAQILRGGCFKPRTSPYSFQGHGFEALAWLADAGAEAGLPIVTEVMHPQDVGPVAERAHILQIGARNMQNFSLLKEVGKVDRPVMLKRGMMSSIEEWLSASEYILSHGNQMVFLCERGIRTFETATRNTLDLSAVPVLRERTHLPVIVDPSHAVGVRRFIPPMAIAALASGAQGVMLEIHPNPEQALSDGPQALTFDMFEQLMARIGAA
jgi:chorismate mutase/prephenate dehydratase